MKRFLFLIVMLFILAGCGANPTEEKKVSFATEMLPEETESITTGPLSKEHEYFDDLVEEYPEYVEDITEISIYDKEIDDYFVIHLSLPPEYDASVKYPMVVMTDGIWRLLEHARYRAAMEEGTLQKLIMVSIGYPNDYNAGRIREREFLQQPEYFLHFIVDNLVPYLTKNYSVDEQNMMLTGHSYGGFFTYHALFDCDGIAKQTFRNYYIGSTAIPNESGMEKMFLMENDYHQRFQDMNCNVYVSVGSLEPFSYLSFQESMERQIRSRKYENLSYTCEVLEGYNHEGVCGPSSERAIYLFYGIEENAESK